MPVTFSGRRSAIGFGLLDEGQSGGGRRVRARIRERAILVDEKGGSGLGSAGGLTSRPGVLAPRRTFGSWTGLGSRRRKPGTAVMPSSVGYLEPAT